MKTDAVFTARRNRLLLGRALAAAVASSFACAYFMSREWEYLRVSAAQKSRLLRLPGILAETDREIVHEQQELVRIQGEIRTRLGQK